MQYYNHKCLTGISIIIIIVAETEGDQPIAEFARFVKSGHWKAAKILLTVKRECVVENLLKAR